jgi:histidinol-phosphate aminotransferase
MKNAVDFIPDKIAKLEDYIPVENDAHIKLDANENPYTMSAPLREKLSELARTLDYNRYPDPYARALTAKFAEVYGVEQNRVVAGCGSDELIHLFCQALFGGGEEILTSPPDFSMYAFYAYLAGGKVITSRRGTDGELDFEALKALAHNGSCRCVMFSNPCNPTGAVANRDTVLDFIKSVDCIVAVDEAYGEFCSSDFSVLELAGKIPNLIVFKTLSKAFGLAALRVGFAVAHEDIIKAVLRVKSPYNLNAFSQTAGVAVLDEAGRVFTSAKQIGADTKSLYYELLKLAGDSGFTVTEPSANFILLRFADAPHAAKIHAELLRRMVSVRFYGGGVLRITCGTQNENRIFMRYFTEILKSGVLE